MKDPRGAPDRRRILFVQRPAGGGSAESLHETVRRLDRSRFEPLVLFHRPGPWSDRFRALGVETLHLGGGEGTLGRGREEGGTPSKGRSRSGRWRVPRPRWLREASGLIRRDLPLAWRTARLIRKKEIDLVHHNNNPAANRASILGAILGGVPQVAHVRFFGRYYRPIDERLCRRVDRFVCVSASVATHCRRRLRLPEERVDVVHNPVDLERFTGARGRRSGTRRHLGVEPGDRLVVHVGRLVPWKGQGEFLEAVAPLAAVDPRVRVLVVGGAGRRPGDRKYREALGERVRDLGLEDRIRLTGHRRDVAELMAAADVMVHSSSEPEPFGRVIVEAMAAGTAVIATRAGGVLDIVRDGQTGLLVPPGDTGALREAIRRLLEAPRLRARLARAAGRHVQEAFSPDRAVEALTAVHRAALRDRPQRGTGPGSSTAGAAALPVGASSREPETMV